MMSPEVVQKKVALLGAFDRFNYGDLLFPLIVSNEMALHSPDTTITAHSLIASDFSCYGAIKTQNYRALCRPGVLQANDTVMFAGGGTIGANWSDMHRNISGVAGNKVLYYLGRLLGPERAEALSRLYFGGKAPYPWVAGPADFSAAVRVAYNAVGGSEFAHIAPVMQSRILDRLSKATFLSVRDAETKRLLAPIEDTVEIHLSPDSAILMSEQFPVSYLESKASDAIKTMIAAGPYVCFQTNVKFARRNSDGIAALLSDIYESFGLRALLLPIGRYVGLDDQIALKIVQQKVRTPTAIVSDEASIWEIMLVLAKAHLFLGTSLHGNVTAQSFAVPHLGLSSMRPNKLDYYLATWDLPEQSRCVTLDEAIEAVAHVLNVPTAVRLVKRNELIVRAHDNFKNMASACDLDWQLAPSPPATH
jgi:hypothetical protein